MKTIINMIRKTMVLFLTAITLTNCSKEGEQHPGSTDECWYKVTIDGQTTLPNQFGQDAVTIVAGINSRGEGLVTMGIHQAKGSSVQMNKLTNRVYAVFTAETPTGTYPVWFLESFPLHTPTHDTYPFYKTYKSPTDPDLTFTLVENSDQRIHMTVSGRIRRIERVDGEEKNTGYVPLEADIIVGRDHVYEESYGDIRVSNTNCDCQNK